MRGTCIGEEGEEAKAGEATPQNQAKRSKEDKGNSGNSEGHVRKAQDWSAIMSERVREEHSEARLELIGEEENIPLINPSGNEPSNPAKMQLSGDVSPTLKTRSIPSPPLLSSNVSQIAPDTEHRNAHLRLADSFSSLPRAPHTEKPPSAQEGSMSTTQEGGTPVELDNER